MEWRVKRKITILVILGLALSFIPYSLYKKIHVEPTCFDTKRNQGEEGVDCGGPCIPCRFLTVNTIEVVWSKFLLVREGSYDGIAFIKNPNPYYGSLFVEYSFELLDDKNALIATREGNTFLLPGEQITIIEPDIRTNLKAKTVSFKVKNVSWGRVYEPTPRYDVGLTKREYEVTENAQGISQSVVKTGIFNNTNETFSRVFVSVFLYDNEKNIIGVSKTILENVTPLETRPLTFVWPGKVADTVSAIEGEVRINSFLR